MSKSGKTPSIEVDSKRGIAGDQNIQPNVKLLASNKERIIDVSLNDI